MPSICATRASFCTHRSSYTQCNNMVLGLTSLPVCFVAPVRQDGRADWFIVPTAALCSMRSTKSHMSMLMPDLMRSLACRKSCTCSRIAFIRSFLTWNSSGASSASFTASSSLNHTQKGLTKYAAHHASTYSLCDSTSCRQLFHVPEG